MPKPPIDLPYPYPHGRESEVEMTDHYEASDGQKYYIDRRYVRPEVGGLFKLQYFHFAQDIEKGIQDRRSKMTKEELALDNHARDMTRSRARNAKNFNPLNPAYENIYSRTDDEGNVIVPSEEPKRSLHFNAGCNCFS
jgi:hypothetical protein